MLEVEIFIMVDENGDFVVSTDQSALQEAYDNDIGSATGELATRIIAVKLKVPTPTIITVEAVVPDEESVPSVTVG